MSTIRYVRRTGARPLPPGCSERAAAMPACLPSLHLTLCPVASPQQSSSPTKPCASCCAARVSPKVNLYPPVTKSIDLLPTNASRYRPPAPFPYTALSPPPRCQADRITPNKPKLASLSVSQQRPARQQRQQHDGVHTHVARMAHPILLAARSQADNGTATSSSPPTVPPSSSPPSGPLTLELSKSRIIPFLILLTAKITDLHTQNARHA